MELHLFLAAQFSTTHHSHSHRTFSHHRCSISKLSPKLSLPSRADVADDTANKEYQSIRACVSSTKLHQWNRIYHSLYMSISPCTGHTTNRNGDGERHKGRFIADGANGGNTQFSTLNRNALRRRCYLLIGRFSTNQDSNNESHAASVALIIFFIRLFCEKTYTNRWTDGRCGKTGMALLLLERVDWINSEGNAILKQQP